MMILPRIPKLNAKVTFRALVIPISIIVIAINAGAISAGAERVAGKCLLIFLQLLIWRFTVEFGDMNESMSG